MHMRSRQGFSLVQVSIMLLAASVIMVSLLPGGDMGGDAGKIKITRERMQKIEEAAQAFMAKNLRRPCPADGSIALGAATFGTEVTSSSTTAATRCDQGGEYYYSAAFNIAVGIVPTKTLGLADEYALDGYGRRIMYFVDKRATGPQLCRDLQSVGMAGSLQIADNFADVTAKDYTMWALVSYGKDGHGAFPANGSTKAARMSKNSTDDDTLYNSIDTATHAFAASITTGIYNGGRLVSKAPTTTFDDIVWYIQDSKNTCCMGKWCSLGFRIDGTGTAAILPADTNFTNIASGDINGDGMQDLVYCMSNVSAGGGGTGRCYVVFGSPSGWPQPTYNNSGFDITSLDGTNGFAISNDTNSGGGSPTSLCGANTTIGAFGKTLAVGDINADGYDDIVIGGTRPTLIFGGTGPRTGVGTYAASWPSELLLSSIVTAADPPAKGFFMNIATPAGAASAVALGDIDGDGDKDLVMHTGTTSNDIYVLLGQSAAYANGNAPYDGTNCMRMSTIMAAPTAYWNKIRGDATLTGPRGYFSLATGDVNGDGADDILVGSNTASGNTGWAYILFGRKSTYSPNWISGIFPTILVATTTLFSDGDGALDNTIMGIRLNNTGSSYHGSNVAIADMNGDTYKDLVIRSSTRIFIYYGGAPASVWSSGQYVADAVNGNYINLNDGGVTTDANVAINLTTSLPSATYQFSNLSANYTNMVIGDVNNDGLNDILLGTSYSNPFYPDTITAKLMRTGSVFVLMQPTAGWPAYVNGTGVTIAMWGTTSAGTTADNWFISTTGATNTAYPINNYYQGFRIDGAYGNAIHGTTSNVTTDYTWVPFVMDLNNDGKNDIIVGSSIRYGNRGGISVLWGRKDVPWDSVIDLNELY